jgi:hypothetical protein
MPNRRMMTFHVLAPLVTDFSCMTEIPAPPVAGGSKAGGRNFPMAIHSMESGRTVLMPMPPCLPRGRVGTYLSLIERYVRDVEDGY